VMEQEGTTAGTLEHRRDGMTLLLGGTSSR